MIGKSFSQYKIVEKIGEGGMGEVYRAEDSTLQRQVAIKVLPAHLLDDTERLARFKREAQVLASLNHPGIASVIGLEETEGHQCLIMELVEGLDLHQRLQQGPIPPSEVLLVAAQVAEALEAAHERGVIHRDLKPANIKLRPDGRVKVLDFGLAKAVEGDTTEKNPQLSASPTITGMMTGANVILGTAAYMSPEQARGHVVDKRADIWAYGCVLYELLTARQAFQGATVSDTLASVLKSEADWDALPANTPGRLRTIMERCLIKDPKQRLRDIGEARIVLAGDEPQVAVAETPVGAGRAGIPPWAIGLLTILVAIAAGAGWFLKPVPPVPTLQGAVLMPEGQRIHTEIGSSMSFSPDGTRIAFSAVDTTGVSALWVRNLTDEDSHRMGGTDGARYPFWSPDGAHLAFFSQGKLRRIPVAGGSPVAICDARFGRGGAWMPDDTILFAPIYNSGLQQVRASGGEAHSFLELRDAELSLRWPEALPEGGLLYTSVSDEAGVYFLAEGDTARLVIPGPIHAEYMDGELLYLINDVLFARPFDAGRGEFTGDPRTVTGGVLQSRSYSNGFFTAASGGNIAFLKAVATSTRARLVQYSREGEVIATWDIGDAARDLAMSPDGRRVAFSRYKEDSDSNDIWILDLNRGVQSRVTFTDDADDPVWSPDGKRLAYAGNGNLFVIPASGVGDPQQVTDTADDDCTHQWSADGRFLIWSRSGKNLELWIHDFETGEQTRILHGEHGFSQGQISPDGRWIAYVSNQSGQKELYLQDFPGLTDRWRISAAGGTEPQWNGTGEILYQARGNCVSVSLGLDDASPVIGQERVLFKREFLNDRSIQVILHPDGQSLWYLDMPEESLGEQLPIRFILNWTGE